MCIPTWQGLVVVSVSDIPIYAPIVMHSLRLFSACFTRTTLFTTMFTVIIVVYMFNET